MRAEQVLDLVVAALEEAAIPYMLVGSFSSNLYGIPRSTQDADFVVQMEPAQFQALAQRLGPEFRIDPQMSFETVTAEVRCVARRNCIQGGVLSVER